MPLVERRRRIGHQRRDHTLVAQIERKVAALVPELEDAPGSMALMRIPLSSCASRRSSPAGDLRATRTRRSGSPTGARRSRRPRARRRTARRRWGGTPGRSSRAACARGPSTRTRPSPSTTGRRWVGGSCRRRSSTPVPRRRPYPILAAARWYATCPRCRPIRVPDCGHSLAKSGSPKPSEATCQSSAVTASMSGRRNAWTPSGTMTATSPRSSINLISQVRASIS